MTELAIVVLAAGAGTRMKSARPKVLHGLAGKPMLMHVLDNARQLKPKRLIVVIAPGQDDVAALAAPAIVAIQAQPRGTGHAVKAARQALKGFTGDVVVIYGDTPLLRAATIRRLVNRRRSARAAVAVLGFRPQDPTPYGRFIVAGPGKLDGIVETRDASAAQRRIGLCNSGVMAIQGAALFGLLDRIGNRNAKREYYLTDLVGAARSAGKICAYIEGDAGELQGINSRAELAMVEAALQQQLRSRALEQGVTMLDPNSVFLSHDTKFGRDVSLGPSLYFGPGVRVADNVSILGYCHIEGARIGRGARIGPFARIRAASTVGAQAHIGNFVELKNTVMDEGAKANHLAYLGDATIGTAANIGAGFVAVNYDGFGKYRTQVGAGAFIGSNASLVAPVRIGAGAIVGAGSVIVRDVPAQAVALGRADQQLRFGAAPRLRARKQAQAAAAKAAAKRAAK